MRCAFVSPHFPPAPGGVGDHLFHLAGAVAEFGIEPVVVTSRADAGSLPAGVELHRTIARWEEAAVNRIAGTIRDLRADVVNLHYSPYLYARYGIARWLPDLIRATQRPWVTTFHEVAVRMEFLRPKSWPLAGPQRRIARRLAEASSALVLTVPYYRRLLGSVRTPAHVVPVGSNVPPAPLSDDTVARLRARLAAPDEIVLATFGANVPWRRTDVLLRALARAGQGQVRMRLVLIGDQGQPGSAGRRTLDALVAELGLASSVHVTGRLEAPDVFAHLRAADLFVLLDSDPYGGVSTKSTSLVAAFGAGLPILGNRGRLTDPLLAHGANIYLLESLRVGTVAEALTTLARSPDVRHHLAAGSLATYRQHLAWNVLAARYADILRSI